MNYLELCQKLRSECGISGDGPVTVDGQTGQLKLLVNWINDAWIRIQSRRKDWYFMWNIFSFQTAANIQDYTAIDAGLTDLAYWERNSLRLYQDSKADERWLSYLPYQQWRSCYGRGEITSNTPNVFTILPNNSLRLTPTPDDSYTVSGDYAKVPSKLIANEDTPALPQRFHDLIVYEALILFGLHEESPAVVQQGQMLALPLWTELYRDQLPDVEIGPALA
jgi:hypothetical protein